MPRINGDVTLNKTNQTRTQTQGYMIAVSLCLFTIHDVEPIPTTGVCNTNMNTHRYTSQSDHRMAERAADNGNEKAPSHANAADRENVIYHRRRIVEKYCIGRSSYSAQENRNIDALTGRHSE